MTEEVTYPLPTVHLNGTGKEMLLGGNLEILGAINDLKEAIQSCEFHPRDYYVQGDEAFSLALEERRKHLQAIADMERYFIDHVEHIIEQ